MAVEQVSPIYDSSQHEDWLEWFLDSNVTDERTLVTALQSVPPEHWLFVEIRLRGALDAAKSDLLPLVSFSMPVRYRRYSPDELAQWRLVERKEHLFFDEVWRRREAQMKSLRQPAMSAGT